jgi:hypothetical protein
MRAALAAVALALAAVGAQAREVGRLENANFLVLFYNDAYVCPAGTTVTAWFGPDNAHTLGCWFERYDIIWVFFADGDKGAYSKDRITWKGQ